jgi:hypothetical protein
LQRLLDHCLSFVSASDQLEYDIDVFAGQKSCNVRRDEVRCANCLPALCCISDADAGDLDLDIETFTKFPPLRFEYLPDACTDDAEPEQCEM